MNVLKKIKQVFHARVRKISHPTTNLFPQPSDFYFVDPLRAVAHAQLLIDRFGGDFSSFIYRKDLFEFLNQEALPVLYAGVYHEFLRSSYWRDKHPFNFPGPIYTGITDTCGTGVPEAPDNVLFDGYFCEYLFRQPRNFKELSCVLDAAAVEVFDGYAGDGNQYWTWAACREWWRAKDQMIHQLLHDPEYLRANGRRGQLYVDYLNSTAELDLRKYGYFLENGDYPKSDDIALPEL